MLNMAVVGLGRWARRLADLAGTSGKLRFVAGVTRDPSRHADFADRFGVPLMGFDEALGEPGIDAMLIATPHTLHRDQVIAAAEAGKHVFVEKPLALTRADAEAALAACRAAGVTVGHGFNRRFLPAYRELGRRLANGDLGDLLFAEAQHSGPAGFGLRPGMWRADPRESPGGAMAARGIHVLDALIALVGPVASVTGRSERRAIEAPVDDVTSAVLEFENGLTGHLASHYATADIWRVQLYGTKGWIEMRGEFEAVYAPLEGAHVVMPMPAPGFELANLEAFADAVAGRASYPVTDAEAINCVAAFEALVRSAATGRPVAVAA